MQDDKTYVMLLREINKIQGIDCHTHLDSSHLAARGLHDIMLYHMVISELYSAGCPNGVRLSDDPDEQEKTDRIEQAIPYLDYIQNSACTWLMRIILSDLYDWNESITLNNWRVLDERMQKKYEDKQWAREIQAKTGITKSSTEYALRRDGSNDDILYYSLEWAFFMRNQREYPDAPLLELEWAWQFDEPVRPLGLLWEEPPPAPRRIQTLAEAKEAMKHYCDAIPFEKVTSTANYLSSEVNYDEVSDEQMQKALDNRSCAGVIERDVYVSWLFEAYLQALEKASRKIVFQFSVGAEPMPHETSSRLRQETLRQIAETVIRHPGLEFQAFLANCHTNQSFCTLCRELPNLSLVGYWWHNFFPGIIAQVIDERLDMLPVNRQIGFFSDAYCVDWQYAKSKLVRSELAQALAKRVDRGQYNVDLAVDIADQLLRVSPGNYC